MITAVEIRLYPTSSQRTMLDKTFGCSRFVYNECLRINKDKYESEKKFDLNISLPEMKVKHDFLKEVSAVALQQAQRHFNEAMRRFFAKKTDGVGFPRFKKRTGKNSFTIPMNEPNQNVSIEDGRISIPKIKGIKFRCDKKVDWSEVEIRSATVKRSPSMKYYASILVQVPDKEPLPKNDKIIGIDLGVSEFAVTSDGERIEPPKFLSKYLDKLKFQQRALSRCVKGSKNREWQRLCVARVHEKIANQRKYFLHKLSRRLIDENQVICLETLGVKGLLENNTRNMSRAISDCSWSMFVEMLKYKAERAGRTIVQIGRSFPSSQLCNVCGYRYDPSDFGGVEWSLKIRRWQCPHCHADHDRDFNASLNILKEGLRISGQGLPVEPVDTGAVEAS